MTAKKKSKSAKHLSKGKKLQAQKPLTKGSSGPLFEVKDYSFDVSQ
ncbi:MAG TPA: hypothetical protein VJW93_11020 [Candidatus Acidoferrales bacterium]|nr:hypothetical protein [Candidatus Acidoferrales bacterium]